MSPDNNNNNDNYIFSCKCYFLLVETGNRKALLTSMYQREPGVSHTLGGRGRGEGTCFGGKSEFLIASFSL